MVRSSIDMTSDEMDAITDLLYKHGDLQDNTLKENANKVNGDNSLQISADTTEITNKQTSDDLQFGN